MRYFSRHVFAAFFYLLSFSSFCQVLTSEVVIEDRANTIFKVDGNTVMEVHPNSVKVNGVLTADNLSEVKVFNQTLQLTTGFQDTGISHQDLVTGTYAIQVYVHDQSVGGGHWHEYYSGIMSWISSSTNNSGADLITLHQAGHAKHAGVIELRTQRNRRESGRHLVLQIRANYNASGPINYRFKFKKLI